MNKSACCPFIQTLSLWQMRIAVSLSVMASNNAYSSYSGPTNAKTEMRPSNAQWTCCFTVCWYGMDVLLDPTAEGSPVCCLSESGSLAPDITVWTDAYLCIAACTQHVLGQFHEMLRTQLQVLGSLTTAVSSREARYPRDGPHAMWRSCHMIPGVDKGKLNHVTSNCHWSVQLQGLIWMHRVERGWANKLSSILASCSILIRLFSM